MSSAKRKIIAFDNVSADGFFADAGGGLAWTIPSGEVTAAAFAAAPNVDTMLFGRKTYEMFESAWRDKAANPHDGKETAESRQMATFINDQTKVVFSHTLEKVTWKNARLLRDADARTVTALKDEPGGNIIVFGSGMLLSKLTELGLVDEYTFVVNPVFLGGGKSLLHGILATKLRLLDSRAFASGHIMARFARE